MNTLLTLSSVVSYALVIAIAYGVGRYVQYRKSQQQLNDKIDELQRYKTAIHQFQTWCSHLHPAFDLIGRQLIASSEGSNLNAGTPVADEPCTIDGLREQLARMVFPRKLS